jgi:hypothetical protein
METIVIAGVTINTVLSAEETLKEEEVIMRDLDRLFVIKACDRLTVLLKNEHSLLESDFLGPKAVKLEAHKALARMGSSVREIKGIAKGAEISRATAKRLVNGITTIMFDASTLKFALYHKSEY